MERERLKNFRERKRQRDVEAFKAFSYLSFHTSISRERNKKIEKKKKASEERGREFYRPLCTLPILVFAGSKFKFVFRDCG